MRHTADPVEDEDLAIPLDVTVVGPDNGAERPEWEGRIRAWIEAVAPEESAPSTEMPAWQRVRRQKRRAASRTRAPR
jgi:hypothetical protein